jgi:hypothetical protein
MNDDQLDDLKQFIAATVSQAEMRLDQKIDQGHKEMQDGFAGVAEAIEQINTKIDEQKTTVDNRFMKLEQQAV